MLLQPLFLQLPDTGDSRQFGLVEWLLVGEGDEIIGCEMSAIDGGAAHRLPTKPEPGVGGGRMATLQGPATTGSHAAQCIPG